MRHVLTKCSKIIPSLPGPPLLLLVINIDIKDQICWSLRLQVKSTSQVTNEVYFVDWATETKVKRQQLYGTVQAYLTDKGRFNFHVYITVF